MHNYEFTAVIVEYLKSIIKLDFTWSDVPDESEVQLQSQVQQDLHPGYEFPMYCDTNDEDWWSDFLYDSKAVAAATQVHIHTSTCHKKGTACRFHFDGLGKPLFQNTTVNLENGTIELKRAHLMVNNHNPAIASITRSNHDITAIFTSGLKSLKSMFYITSYVSKGEDNFSDVTVIQNAFHGLERSGIILKEDIVDQTRRLIIRINYLRQSEHHFSGVQIAAMLLRIGVDGVHYTNMRSNQVLVYQFITYLKSESRKHQYIAVPNHRYWRNEDTDTDSDEEEGRKIYQNMAILTTLENSTNHNFEDNSLMMDEEIGIAHQRLN